MPRPRKRFCPYGHDKDAAGGSYWSFDYTTKGTKVKIRSCAVCQRNNANKRRLYRKLRLI